MTTRLPSATPLEYSAAAPTSLRVGTTVVCLVAVSATFNATWELPVYLLMTALLSVAAFIDLETLRLPNNLLGPAFLAGAVLLPLISATTGRGSVASAALASIVGLLGMATLHVAYPAGLGLGDVKLGAVMGLYLGWLSWRAVGMGFAAGFLLAGLTAAALLWRNRSESQALPFGPFLIGGTIVATVIHAI